jgi:hypothetical protein
MVFSEESNQAEDVWFGQALEVWNTLRISTLPLLIRYGTM